jgi:hypothetical protein
MPFLVLNIFYICTLLLARDFVMYMVQVAQGRSLHPKPTRKVRQPIIPRTLHCIRQFLQYPRPIHRIHAPKLPIPNPDIIKLVRILRLHKLYRLLQFVEVLFEDRRVVEGVNEGGEVCDVCGEGGDAVGVYFFDGGGEGEREDEVGGVGEGVEVDQFFYFAREAEQGGGHDVGEVLG